MIWVKNSSEATALLS